MSAKIIRLDDFRDQAFDDEPLNDESCDMVTAIDVAVRDLREILTYWGSEGARVRAQECERMLARVLKHGVTPHEAS